MRSIIKMYFIIIFRKTNFKQLQAMLCSSLNPLLCMYNVEHWRMLKWWLVLYCFTIHLNNFYFIQNSCLFLPRTIAYCLHWVSYCDFLASANIFLKKHLLNHKADVDESLLGCFLYEVIPKLSREIHFTQNTYSIV